MFEFSKWIAIFPSIPVIEHLWQNFGRLSRWPLVFASCWRKRQASKTCVLFSYFCSMDLMFEWEYEGDRFSFDDSDRFEEDSLCSWLSEPESLCNNWRGWKRQNGGQTTQSSRSPGKLVSWKLCQRFFSVCLKTVDMDNYQK